MKNQLFPLIFTNDLAATKRFYLETLGCELAIDAPEYLQVRFGSAGGPELCFMPPKAILGSSGAAFSGQGLIVSVPIADVDGTHATFAGRGAPVVDPPSDRPWGWRSFVCRDPNGVLLDFFREKALADSAHAAS